MPGHVGWLAVIGRLGGVPAQVEGACRLWVRCLSLLRPKLQWKFYNVHQLLCVYIKSFFNFFFSSVKTFGHLVMIIMCKYKNLPVILFLPTGTGAVKPIYCVQTLL